MPHFKLWSSCGPTSFTLGGGESQIVQGNLCGNLGTMRVNVTVQRPGDPPEEEAVLPEFRVETPDGPFEEDELKNVKADCLQEKTKLEDLDWIRHVSYTELQSITGLLLGSAGLVPGMDTLRELILFTASQGNLAAETVLRDAHSANKESAGEAIRELEDLPEERPPGGYEDLDCENEYLNHMLYY